MSSTTPSVARPEALTVLDSIATGSSDSVTPHVRAAAAVNTPDANLSIEKMTADNGTTMNQFVGKEDCSIGGTSATANAADQTAPDPMSHQVIGDLHPVSTLANDTQYRASAQSDSSEVAQQLANNQASSIEQAA